MQRLDELLAVTHRQALEFFVVGLSDVCEGAVDRDELLYNASVLAHHAQVSTQQAFDLPTPPDLAAVFDHFVVDQSLAGDASMMEAAGTHCLLLTGFFGDQMRQRHNIRWYAELGSGFFRRAATLAASPRKGVLLVNLARHFEPWRVRQARLSRELRDMPYLLMPPDRGPVPGTAS